MQVGNPVFQLSEVGARTPFPPFFYSVANTLCPVIALVLSQHEQSVQGAPILDRRLVAVPSLCTAKRGQAYSLN
jgi:hypothetical protein